MPRGKRSPRAPDTDTNRELKRRLVEKKLKLTSERKLILDSIREVGRHFDAEGLYAAMKKQGHQIARDTVFRTLPLLLELGLLQKSVGEGRGEYFEAVGSEGHHDHLVCLQCDRVIEFHSPEIERWQQKLCESYGFTLAFHDHRLFGYCLECQERHAERRPQ